MPVLRLQPRPESLTTRQASPDDLAVVLRLLDSSGHRSLGVSYAEIGGLLAGTPGIMLLDGGAPCGVILAGWAHGVSVWQRVLALHEALPVMRALGVLLPPFHDALRARGSEHVYISGDEAADPWHLPALRTLGYVHDTDVIVYEKTRMNVPSQGNAEVRVRPATAVDLPAILAVDARCFSAEWCKDDAQLGIALHESPRFLVVEKNETIIGYAFVTSHYDGRLVHLVRIAVHPDHRGKGLGARLLFEVVAFAGRTGADIVTLNTQAYNRAARRLYEWFGFRRTGEKQTVLRYDL